jgi:hypothetical protein
MKVQIRQIKGDIVELLFNPKEIDLRVGENLSLRENGHDRGLIVQIIEFRTVTYSGLLNEMMELVTDAGVSPEAGLMDLDSLPEMSNLKLAIAKIRKVVTWNESRSRPQMASRPV